MTSSIKPPGSRPPGGPQAPGTPELPGAVPAGSSPRGEAFREAVEASRPPAVGGPQAAEAARGADPLGPVRQALSEGRITASEAVEQLVQRALQRPDVQALPPVARAELEAVLRHALSNDPNLSALAHDLDEGSGRG